MHNRLLLLSLIPLTCGVVLTGCPPIQNNDTTGPEDMSDVQKDMAEPREDMPADTSRDMVLPEDMSGEDMSEEDMPEDMSAEDDAPILLQKPASTSSTKTAPSLTFRLFQTRRASPRNRWTHIAVANGPRARLADGDLDGACEPADEGFVCEVTLATPPPPEGGDAWPTGVHTLTLSAEDGSGAFEVPMHVHLPWEEVKKQDVQPASLPLPAHYARCGIDAKIKALDAGPGVVSVMFDEAGEQVTLDLSADGLEDPTPARSVGISSPDILASDFEVIQRPGGGLSAAWWAYDDRRGMFCGITEHFKSTGITEGGGAAFCADSPVSIARVIDAQWGVRQDGASSFITARIMAITTEGKWVALGLFDGTQKVVLESNQEDLFFNLPAAMISNKNTGFLYTDPSKTSLATPRVWQVTPLESDGAPPAGVRFHTLSFTQSGETLSASVDLPAPFEVKDTYVGHSNTGKIFVLLLGAQDEQALFETELTQMDSALAAPVAKDLPAQVGIERRRQKALDRRRREARLKRQTRKTRQGFAPHRIELVSAGGQTTALGRWPWNWRDRLKADALAHPNQDVIQGPMRVGTSRVDEVPVAVTWIDGESDLKLVAPMTGQFEASGQAAGKLAGTQGALCMSRDGNRIAAQNTSFEPGFCEANEDACSVRIASFEDGHGLVLVPGQTGLEVRQEALGKTRSQESVQGLKLVRAPVPIGNVFSMLSARTNLIFEEPFEGPAPLETEPLSPQFMGTMNDSDDGATHGVWVRNWQTGKISGPGRVRFETGAQGPELGPDTTIQSMVFATDDERDHFVIEAVIDVTYANAETQATFGTPERYVVSIPHDDLLASVDNDGVTVIDLTGTPPIKQDAVTIEPHAIAHPPRLLSPLVAGRHFASDTEFDDIIEVSPSQGRAPLLVSTSGEGCGVFQIQSLESTAEGALALTTLDGHSPSEADCADQEILLGTGDFTGEGNDTTILSLSRNPRRLRIRLGIRRKIPGSADSPKLGVIDTDLPDTVALGDPEASLSATVDDFNGDFIDDVAITTGATSEQPASTLIMFGDGLGGFLPETVQADAPPTRRGVTEKAGEVCVGFYDDETRAWTCEDNVLEDRNDHLLCGTTDHF